MGETRFQDYVLLKHIDWFGRPIPAGTIYKQVTNDCWHPTIDGAQCPNLAVTFMTVRANDNYFLAIQR
jgi:hypothetical protein